VGQYLRAKLADMIAHARAGRIVTCPEDVNPLVRSLAAAADRLTDYGRVFTSAGKYARDELQEELREAVGEQDGIPAGNLTVPDLDGTNIKITRDTANNYTIDRDALYAAVAAQVLEAMGGLERILRVTDQDHENPNAFADEMETVAAGVLIEAMQQIVELGAFEPQISKVRAYALELAGMGADGIAASITSTITKKVDYRGIKYERVERKSRRG
jgi:hypothetical protein